MQSYVADLKKFTKDHGKLQCFDLGFALDTFRMVALTSNFRKLQTDSVVKAYTRCAVPRFVTLCCAGTGEGRGGEGGVLKWKFERGGHAIKFALHSPNNHKSFPHFPAGPRRRAGSAEQHASMKLGPILLQICDTNSISSPPRSCKRVLLLDHGGTLVAQSSTHQM